MSDHPNLKIMRDVLEAFRSGDMPTLARLLAQDIVWRVPGNSTLAKDYRGQEEVFAFFARLMEGTNGTFRVEPVDVMANDRGGVFVDRITAQRNGKALEIGVLLRVTIFDGQIVEAVDYFHQEHLWDAFWS